MTPLVRDRLFFLTDLSLGGMMAMLFTVEKDSSLCSLQRPVSTTPTCVRLLSTMRRFPYLGKRLKSGGLFSLNAFMPSTDCSLFHTAFSSSLPCIHEG